MGTKIPNLEGEIQASWHTGPAAAAPEVEMMDEQARRGDRDDEE